VRHARADFPSARAHRERRTASDDLQDGYEYAERAGFQNNPIDDWLKAEREVDARLQRLAS
jgi:hypothetical protein